MRHIVRAVVCAGLACLIPARAESAGEQARQLAADLVSSDAVVREKATRDLINGEYRALTDTERLAAVVAALGAPDSDPHSIQGLMIEYLPVILGSEAKRALPTLLTYIADAKISPYLRGKAMAAAARIAPENPVVVTALIDAAAPRNGQTAPVLDSAVEELGKIGRSAAPAKPMLKELLEAKDQGVQDVAFEALGRIVLDASPAAEFRRGLVDKDPGIRAAAHAQLRQRAVPRDAPPRDLTSYRAALLQILENHGDDIDRRAALATLATLGPGGDPRMIKALLACMTGGGISSAERALALSEPTAPAAVRVLLESMRRNSKEPRSIATMATVRALRAYGVSAGPAVPDLLAGVDRLVVIPRHEFATEEVGDYLAVLVAAGPADPAVIGRILDLIALDHPLNHPMKPYRPVAPLALAALATIGVPTDPTLHKRAVTRLAEALADGGLAAGAAAVLEKTDVKVLAPDAATFVPLLVKIVKTARQHDAVDSLAVGDLQLRVSAIRTLSRLGPAAKEAEPVLKKLADRRRLPPSYNARYLWENTITEEARKALNAVSPP